MAKITEITGGQAFRAGSLAELKSVYATLQEQIGYETIRADGGGGWIRLGAALMAIAILAGLVLNRRLPE